MLAAGIVIFREILEIVLIVGIVLAATRDMQGRGLWIGLGIGAGLAGSAAVAFFTDQISEFAEGMGQELFNASIMIVAALFIGWTVLWMSRHAREMKAHFHQVGERISSGSLPYYSLSIVIALAMLREGSEIVLFSYGMIASGQSLSSILIGGLIGGVGGLIVGLLIYFGLISLSPKYFLRVTSALLILLVAGLMSQAIGFLVAAGYFENLSQTVWDSSWLLDENNPLGIGLQALVGYTSRPVTAQLLVYGATVLLLFTLVRYNSKPARAPVS